MGRKTPLPTPIRTYGASILGLIAPTELDTRHPLSKILDPPLSLAYGQPVLTVSLLLRSACWPTVGAAHQLQPARRSGHGTNNRADRQGDGQDENIMLPLQALHLPAINVCIHTLLMFISVLSNETISGLSAIVNIDVTQSGVQWVGRSEENH